MPVLEREEYIEQAYFFHAFRERLLDGLPAQDILARIGEELLSTTRLPLAVSFLYTDIKGSGLMAPAMSRIGHYFTPFQTHVIDQAEQDTSRFAMEQALLILERRGEVQGREPLPARPVRLPVRVALAQPPGLHQGPGRHGRRPVLQRGLAGLHPDPPQPAGRRRFRRPDLRALRVLHQGTHAAQPRVRPQVPRALRREGGQDRPRQPRARPDVPLLGPAAAARIPRSPPARGVPTSSRPACCSSSRRSPSSRTGSRPPRATCSRTTSSPRSWSSPRTPRASRPAGGRSLSQ